MTMTYTRRSLVSLNVMYESVHITGLVEVKYMLARFTRPHVSRPAEAASHCASVSLLGYRLYLAAIRSEFAMRGVSMLHK